MVIFPHSSSISVISLMLLPDAIQDISSVKDSPVAPVFCSAWSNTPEMYIANRTGCDPGHSFCCTEGISIVRFPFVIRR
jgi:hypothetical protein